MASSNAIIIGGGHNGLVCAAYLARAGLSVTVLEADHELGGAAKTIEIAPGTKVSGCAHILNQLHPKVVADLQLEEFGLEYAAADMDTVALDSDGKHLVIKGGDAELSGDGIATGDREVWPEFRARLMRFADTLKPMLGQTPPRLKSPEGRDSLALAKLGWSVRKLGRDDLREFLRVILINVADLLEDEFEDDRLKGAVALDAVLGTHQGPRSPGSLFSLLYRYAGEALGQQGALALPKGGMGAVTQALAQAAEAEGASIVTGAMVEKILVEDDRVKGVRLATGDELGADCIVSAANPRTTLLGMLGPEHLDTGLVRRLRNIRMQGNAAKLHLALDGVPEFKNLDRLHLDGRLVIAPGIDYVERAFNPSKYGHYSPEPVIELTIPSIADPSLAPAGKHVVSAVVQYAPFELKAGWDEASKAFQEKVIDLIAQYAPHIREQITAAQLLTPADLETKFRLPGGHWHHGELAIDQMLMLRPVPGVAQYATPMPGLYLCSAGSHPGGGVMGAAGMNAAARVIELEGRP